jgi:hypothetical protein
MFLTLLDDPYVDPNELDLDTYFKPRRLSVIFSAFHKILYKKEKHLMRQAFSREVAANYVDF